MCVRPRPDKRIGKPFDRVKGARNKLSGYFVSAAYAFGESQNWKCGPGNKPWEAVGFFLEQTARICALPP